MPVSRFTDKLIVYRILRMLVTPFDKTDAFRLGIIDAKGNVLKRESQLKTQSEKEAYTLLHRLVFRLKRILEKVPVENKKLLSYMAAYVLVKECVEQKIEPLNLESIFIESLTFEMDTTLVENFFKDNYMKTFRQFQEDAALGGVPANNAAASPGLPSLTGEPPITSVTANKYKKGSKKLPTLFKRDK
jgi:hypothetical protein